MKTFREFLLEKEELFSKKQIDDLEKFANRLLNKWGIDIEFYRHFNDRINDLRNNPPIKLSELQQLFKKIDKDKGKKIKETVSDYEAVLVDLSKDLNLPFTISIAEDGEFIVLFKTILRKKHFMTSDNKIFYENLSA